MSFAQATPLVPPFSSPISDLEMGMLTPFWLAWFNQLYQIYYTNLQVLLGVPNNSTVAIAEIQPTDGGITFDSTLKVWKGWNGTDWEIFQTVPA